MESFSEWDFAESFSAVEAALLMEGKKPSDCGPNGRDGYQNLVVSDVILRRMLFDYNHTCSCHGLDLHVYEPAFLSSVMMNLLVGDLTRPDGEASLKKWLLDNEKSDFYKQSFARKDIQRWIDANHLPSLYRFEQNQPPDTETPSGRWPWGAHHTELLGHLEAAALRYWQENYDPTDATTASTNKDVAEWLVTERKVSKKMAEAIASMLRPNGLPTGPRT